LPSAHWSTAACRLAYETEAAIVYAEVNYGGDDMCDLAIRTSWEALQAAEEIPAKALPPMVQTVRAKQGKLLRAEPVAPQMVQDKVGLRGVFTDLEHQWSHWMPTDPDSPGRIDASTILVYGLIPEADQGAIVHAPLPQAPKQGASSAAAYGRRIG
jgi:phage terminase large subunit-like protein